MIIHASAAFAKQLKCSVSLQAHQVRHLCRIDSWNAEITKFRGEPLALMMNDATLFSIILPLKGVRGLPDFLPLFLKRIAGVWADRNVSFDAANQTVVILKRSDRSLIGTMNEAVFMLGAEAQGQYLESDTVDWIAAERFLNNIRFKALSHGRPNDALKRELSG